MAATEPQPAHARSQRHDDRNRVSATFEHTIHGHRRAVDEIDRHHHPIQDTGPTHTGRPAHGQRTPQSQGRVVHPLCYGPKAHSRRTAPPRRGAGPGDFVGEPAD